MKKKTLLTSVLAVASVISLLAFYPTANAQDAADSKLNLRTNSLLRMPSNIPQEHIYDSGISIPYPADGVKGSLFTSVPCQRTRLGKYDSIR